MMRNPWILILCLAWLSQSCQSHSVPMQKARQYQYKTEVKWLKEGVEIHLGNPLGCPLRIWVKSNQNDSLAKRINPIVLRPYQDSTFILPMKQDPITFSSRLGDTSRIVPSPTVGLPFPKGKSYRILQGNQTQFTHQGSFSQFAVDFDLDTGDTIASSSDGLVVGVVESYSKGGKKAIWRDFSNFITIYDPSTGVFFQYVHLKENGSFVSVGDQVRAGDPIGLSGNTGFSTRPHLHFACFKPAHSQDGLQSIPFQFTTGQLSQKVRVGDQLSW